MGGALLWGTRHATGVHRNPRRTSPGSLTTTLLALSLEAQPARLGVDQGFGLRVPPRRQLHILNRDACTLGVPGKVLEVDGE